MEARGNRNLQATGNITVNHKTDRRKVVRRKEDRKNCITIKILLIVQAIILCLLLVVSFRQTNLTNKIETFNQSIDYQDNRILNIENHLTDPNEDLGVFINNRSLENWYREQKGL